jgi:putative transposase
LNRKPILHILLQIRYEDNRQYERQFALKAKGVDIESIADPVAELLDIQVNQVWQSGKSRLQVKARSLLCFWAVRELGLTMTAMSRRLGVSVPAVSKSVVRGGKIAEKNGYTVLS